MNKKYLEVHKLFFDENDIHEWMSKPFISNGTTTTTDGFSLFSSPKILDLEQKDESEKINKLTLPPKITPFTIIRNQLKTALNKVETVPELSTEESETECPECGGWGQVEWEYGGYTKEFDCPVCDGEGTVTTKGVETGRMIPSEIAKMSINETVFQARQLIRVLNVCNILDSDITVVRLDKRQVVFNIEKCSIIVMGSTNFESELITKII